MRWPRRTLLLILLAALPLAGCGDDGNNACESCVNDEDCETGLTCQMFRREPDGAILNMCGDANPLMTCPEP